MATAGLKYIPKGKWVFKEGDKGDCMYVILYGETQVLVLNTQYLEYRRLMRDLVK